MKAPGAALATTAAVVSTTLGGAAAVVTRYLSSSMEPVAIAGWRYAIALVLVALLAVDRGRWRVSNERLWPIIALGVVYFGVYPYLFAAGLAKTTAGRGALLLSTMPLMTLLLGGVFKIEAITPRRLIGVVIAILGVALAVADDVATDEATTTGDWLMLAAALVGAICQLALKKPLESHGTLPVTLWTMVGGVTALEAAGAFSAGVPTLDVAGWSALVFLAVFCGAFGLLLWGWAIRHTSPTRAAVCVTVNPIVALILAWPMLGEPITAQVAVGTLLVIAGIVVAAKP